MQTIEQSSRLRDITRGGQILIHSFRMFGQVLKTALMCSLGLFIALFIWLASQKTTEYERYILGQTIEAHLKVMLNEEAYNVVKNPKGVHPPHVQINSAQFLQMPLAIRYVDHCLEGFFWAFKWSFGLSILSLVFVLWFLMYQGRRHHICTEVSGQARVSPKELKQLLKREKEDSDLTLAGIPLAKNSETQHILLAGTTGSGKSVAMQQLMDQVRQKRQKAVVFDIDGALIAHYYRPDKDIILNPLDERCLPWNIWQECRDRADYESDAHSLMPLHLSGSDPVWIHGAHNIFSSVAQALAVRNQKQNKLLLEYLFTEQLESLSLLVAGTPAESLVSEKIEKTALSLKMTLSTYCKSLSYLRDDTEGPLFSIRRWIEAEEQDTWLFIATDERRIDALRPLLSLWFDVAAKSVLTLSPFSERRLWFFIDELPELQRLPSLKVLLQRGRKYGACFVGSIQDVHQFHSVYGRDDAKTLASLFNTKLFFRNQEPASKQWMAEVMDDLEFLEKKEGFSYGANDMRDGVSIHQERRRESVIKASEFSCLKNLQAFLKLQGNWPVTQIEFKYKKRVHWQPYFIPREVEEPSIPEPNLSDGENKNEEINKTKASTKDNENDGTLKENHPLETSENEFTWDAIE